MCTSTLVFLSHSTPPESNSPPFPPNSTAGNAIAATIRAELKTQVDEMRETLGVTPGLAVVLVGERRDSATYVRMKKKACTEIGIRSVGIDLSADITQAELVAKVSTGRLLAALPCHNLPASSHPPISSI